MLKVYPRDEVEVDEVTGAAYQRKPLACLASRPGLLNLWRPCLYGILLSFMMLTGVVAMLLAACCWFGVKLCEQVSEGCVYYVAWYECLQRWRGDSKK